MSHNSALPSVTQENASGVNPGSSQHVMHISCTPPPSYHNINAASGYPVVFVNDRGAPPSYEEVIDPNGEYRR